MFIFTVPSKMPENVKVFRSKDDNTVLVVTWDPLTIVEARGFITYVIEATPSGVPMILQELHTEVPGNVSSVRLQGADPRIIYSVTVSPHSSGGQLGPCKYLSSEFNLMYWHILTI